VQNLLKKMMESLVMKMMRIHNLPRGGLGTYDLLVARWHAGSKVM